MDIFRKIGIGIVMIVPTFVGSGALWDIFNSWIPVLIWFIVMASLYSRTLTLKPEETEAEH